MSIGIAHPRPGYVQYLDERNKMVARAFIVSKTLHMSGNIDVITRKRVADDIPISRTILAHAKSLGVETVELMDDSTGIRYVTTLEAYITYGRLETTVKEDLICLHLNHFEAIHTPKPSLFDVIGGSE